jgi:hypothetical protein
MLRVLVLSEGGSVHVSALLLGDKAVWTIFFGEVSLKQERIVFDWLTAALATSTIGP